MLDFDEIMMLDENIKTKEEQINYQSMIRDNTIRFSEDSESIKKIVVKKIDDVIKKLDKMSENEYKNISFIVPFDIIKDPDYEGNLD